MTRHCTAILVATYNCFFRVLLMATVLFAAMTASTTLIAGELIVDFSPTGDATSNGQGRSDGQIEFSMSEARSPKPAGSKNYGGGNSTFHGGATASSAEIDQFKFDSSDSSIRIRMTGEIDSSAAAVFLWKKEDFASGSDATGISIGRGDSLTVTSRRFGSDIERELRFVVQEEDLYFISDATSGIPSSYGETSIKNPASANWFYYDPTSNISSIGEPAEPTFQNLEAVGVWFQVTKTKAGNATVAIKGFTAKGTPSE